jgi:hypothetical protein
MIRSISICPDLETVYEFTGSRDMLKPSFRVWCSRTEAMRPKACLLISRLKYGMVRNGSDSFRPMDTSMVTRGKGRDPSHPETIGRYSSRWSDEGVLGLVLASDRA